MPGYGFHVEYAENHSIPCIWDPVCLPDNTCQDLLVVVVVKFKRKAVDGLCDPGLDFFVCRNAVPWNFKCAEFHAAFMMRQSIQLVDGVCDVLQVHLLDCFTDDLTAVDELDFCGGRACRSE